MVKTLEDAIDSDDLHRRILTYLEGRECRTASEAVRRWRALQDEHWWHAKARTDLSVGCWPAEAEESWRGAYERCHSTPNMCRWVAGPLRTHCLGDRVAAPQFFVSCRGERLYNYGGWTKLGPQTDLRWTSASNLSDLCRGAGVKPVFRLCSASGRPARRSGAQTLTPLWLPGGSCEPSAAHAAKCAPEDFVHLVRAHLVVAYGGGGGGYADEHNDWAVGVLDDDDSSVDAKVHWCRPGKKGPPAAYTARATTTFEVPIHRCAHTATYVPARCFGHDDFPEGAVLFFGGHAADTRTTLHHLQLLDVATWTWLTDERSGGLNYRLEQRQATGAVARHGHTATLVEYDNQAYVVFVGGGRGTVLEDPERCEEFGTAQAVDVKSLYRRGTSRLRPRYGQLVDLASDYVPGRHHTASLVAPHTVALYGGGHRPFPFVALLDVKEVIQAGKRVVAARAARARALQEIKARAESSTSETLVGLMHTQMQLLAEVDGPSVALKEVEGGSAHAPTPRKFHAACSLYPWHPLLVVFGGWRSSAHFEDLHVAALGTDTKALEPYTRSDLSKDTEEAEDGLLEVRVYVPECGMETLRTSRSRLRFLVTSGSFRAETDGTYRFMGAPVPAPPTMQQREVWTQEGRRVTVSIPETPEGQVPTVDIDVQRAMLYGTHAPRPPHN